MGIEKWNLEGERKTQPLQLLSLLVLRYIQQKAQWPREAGHRVTFISCHASNSGLLSVTGKHGALLLYWRIKTPVYTQISGLAKKDLG